MDKLLVADVVGLTPDLLQHMPRLQRLAAKGSSAVLDPVLPAVTCSVQSTFLTGLTPAEHGIVGNGWYFRDLGEVHLWRQHNRLVQGEKVWETIRRQVPDYTVANVCWWYAMGASTDWTVTPRPIYYADGKKAPDCYTRPPELHDELVHELGEFPLFQYWGPTASLRSTEWIVGAARRLLPRADLTLAYLPHLDYDLQRFGPDSAQARRAAHDVDAALAPLLDDAELMDARVVVLSEYGITRADTPVDINRALRAAGLLNVHTQDGMEYLDPWTSRAFAVADHQVAHVYVADPTDLEQVGALCAGVRGVAQVLDRAGQAAVGLDHERAGELVLVAEPTAWFTYYYWEDDDRAPDFARGVEIHRKPGYDPAELFFDPKDRLVKARAALTLARKAAGLRYSMKVVPLDPAPVRGTHGRLPLRDEEGPMVICDRPDTLGSRLAATQVRDLLLDLAGASAATPTVSTVS
ncbi:putative AlkP superfamily pyrophosphatase or phosphodiesterase [Nocardioides aromaticivorans]|uniref:Putative AlkP superfamily pyrophosphatase or phosphodiesterase n=1 Tax=Nocardioides aromaticivorans TaxID=200618 RepID=A0A7Y9ZK41_9ACTN|nr:nucleotide pyrophosphatase/phosphodiesterase family protein [Nocardioides aromaticivorans]NYI45803.1 putative AlkP superfamily pyrophosphatase or phosphodiesterase [Nocardioides aromaticivorans]